MRTTPTPLLLLFIPYKFLVCMMIKFRIRKEKERKGGHYKTAATKRLSFFFSIKAYVKDLMLHMSEFRVKKYAHKGGFPLSRKF